MLLVAARQDVGVLYGMFHLLRLLQRGTPLQALDVRESRRSHCVLNHWTTWIVTSSVAMQQLAVGWQTLPQWRDPRYTDYARANASLGINAPSSTRQCQCAEPVAGLSGKAAALADLFRPYGIRST